MKRITVSVPVFLLAALSLAGCERPVREPRAFVVGQSGETFEQELALRRATHANDGFTVVVDTTTTARCPGANSSPSTLDAAEMRGALRGTLEAVAACLRDGALRGETLRLRVDTPGEDHAKHRHADDIEAALIALGVFPEQVEIERHVSARSAWSACRIQVSLRADARAASAARSADPR